MKNTFGSCLTVSLFGESHGPAVGVIIDGIAPGIPVDEEAIAQLLSKRRPSSIIDTPRVERDDFRILSGVFNGKTTGTPLTISIPNENIKSKDYSYGPARPSHADYAAFAKYHGFEDYRGGGHFSGRITAALVAAGGILIPALKNIGITLGTHILSCGSGCDRPFSDTENEIGLLETAAFPVLDQSAGEKMISSIEKAQKNRDSIGGITQTAICGLPAGLGEPWFDSVESVISHIVFSIGGIKGIEFGKGFGFSALKGSEANDPMRTENGKVFTLSNNNGGINGGITNGMPVVFQCAVKPTPSIGSPQKTVDFTKYENIDIEISGRHDPAIIRRVCPVLTSAAAIAVCDMLAARFGTDFLKEGFGK